MAKRNVQNIKRTKERNDHRERERKRAKQNNKDTVKINLKRQRKYGNKVCAKKINKDTNTGGT